MAYTTIDDPSEYFQIATYTGTSDDSAKTVVNDGNSDLQPDLLWIKARSGTYGSGRDHALYDSSRGATKRIEPSATDAEATDSGNSFNSDGFTITANYSINGPSTTYVAWQWKANGGTKTTFTESGNNPGGSYQVNTTAGFSILDYTGTGAVGTVAHGLGAVPEVMIVKDRSADGDDWFVYHITTGNDGGVRLNTDGTDGDDSNRWNDTTPTSSVCTFGASGGTNDDGNATVAYVWTPIQGYSKFGNYLGNGSDDGPFIYTGFKPKWVMVKPIDAQSSWFIQDTARDSINPIDAYLLADSTGAENAGSGKDMDFLSNGFKLREATGWFNDNDTNYIYMAFAEHPFVSSKGVPATAR